VALSDNLNTREFNKFSDVAGDTAVNVKVLSGGGGGSGDASAANQVLQLAQETAAAASLSVLDDWDESDRAKVNLIVGQAGVAGGSGVVGATVQRVVLATDVALPAGENHIGEIGGRTSIPTANFTRPSDTTAYASGDLVANSTTAGSVTPMTLTVARVAAGSGMLRKVRLRKSGTSITNASFRVHFYRSSPTVTNGDNGVWLSNQVANYLGAMDVSSMTAFSDGATGNGVPMTGFEINFKLPSGSDLFCLIEARGAYAPANAEVFTLEVEVLQN
jgi:hypothetical protein